MDFIIKHATGTFWTGKQWALEYQDAARYPSRAAALQVAERLVGSVEIWENYGRANVRRVYTRAAA